MFMVFKVLIGMVTIKRISNWARYESSQSWVGLL